MSQEISALRNMMEVMDKKYNTWTGPAFTGSETYHDIEMRDGFMSSLKIQKPASGPPGPLIVLAFGGGFVGGDNNQFTKTGRVLVNVFGATVVSIGYRLAPGLSRFYTPTQALGLELMQILANPW
jgi:acetyl esterase/lipase